MGPRCPAPQIPPALDSPPFCCLRKWADKEKEACVSPDFPRALPGEGKLLCHLGHECWDSTEPMSLPVL